MTRHMMCATRPASPATDPPQIQMIKSMVASALIAGCAVGLLAALLHFAFVQDYILLGEEFESGARVHFENAAPATPEGEGHAHATPDAAAAPHDHGSAAAHDHGSEAEPGAVQRNALTVLFAVLIYTAYALLLAAGFGLAESFGATITARDGLLWGIGGFVTFQLAPAMGLAPELPGTIAAELGPRQLWWWLTVGCTGSGLALLAYGRHWALFGLAGALLALPHVIGAPHPDQFWGVAPPEVAGAFSARVLGTALVVWALLGWVAATVWHREIRST